MGIYNASMNSLFGARSSHENHRENILKMLEDGANIIDIGGESTGPDSPFIDAKTEWERIEEIVKIASEIKGEKKYEFEISIDTYKSEVFEKALAYGVDILNDVTALRGDSRMIEVLSGSRARVCIMYSVNPLEVLNPSKRTNSEKKQYENLMETLEVFFTERISFLEKNGVDACRIILDTGMGAFVSGDPKYSFEIINNLSKIKEKFKKFPILIGASRKSFTGLAVEHGEIVSKYKVSDRLIGSVLSHFLALQNGADIVRVHDVSEAKMSLDFLQSLNFFTDRKRD